MTFISSKLVRILPKDTLLYKAKCTFPVPTIHQQPYLLLMFCSLGTRNTEWLSGSAYGLMGLCCTPGVMISSLELGPQDFESWVREIQLYWVHQWEWFYSSFYTGLLNSVGYSIYGYKHRIITIVLGYIMCWRMTLNPSRISSPIWHSSWIFKKLFHHSIRLLVSGSYSML